MFWPGSETVIGGRQATYWTPFDDDLPNSERVKRVLDWLKLPEGKRPSFLTLYFSDVDNAGHSCGPDSEEVRERRHCSVDQSIGDLVAGVKARRPRRSRALRRRQRSRHGRAQPRSHDRAGRLHRRRRPRMSSTGRRCWRCRRRTATSKSCTRRSRTSIRRSLSIAAARFRPSTALPAIRACRPIFAHRQRRLVHHVEDGSRSAGASPIATRPAARTATTRARNRCRACSSPPARAFVAA